MSAGTSPSAPAGGAPALPAAPLFMPIGRQTCDSCQVTWVGGDPCWICGNAASKPPQPWIYVVQG
jgi:hypothetical protein